MLWIFFSYVPPLEGGETRRPSEIDLGFKEAYLGTLTGSDVKPFKSANSKEPGKLHDALVYVGFEEELTAGTPTFKMPKPGPHTGEYIWNLSKLRGGVTLIGSVVSG